MSAHQDQLAMVAHELETQGPLDATAEKVWEEAHGAGYLVEQVVHGLNDARYDNLVFTAQSARLAAVALIRVAAELDALARDLSVEGAA